MDARNLAPILWKNKPLSGWAISSLHTHLLKYWQHYFEYPSPASCCFCSCSELCRQNHQEKSQLQHSPASRSSQNLFYIWKKLEWHLFVSVLEGLNRIYLAYWLESLLIREYPLPLVSGQYSAIMELTCWFWYVAYIYIIAIAEGCKELYQTQVSI